MREGRSSMIVGGGHNRKGSKAVATGEGRETAAVLEMDSETDAWLHAWIEV